MSTRPSPHDIYDINKRTGALILGSNRLDDYAAKYLTRICKDALKTPMALPVEQILEKEGLHVVEEKLSNNGDVFGCCFLLDSDVPVIDRETSQVGYKHYPAGTILIDPDSEVRLSEGARRNTLIHEAIHWEKDRTYFQIMSAREAFSQDGMQPLMCRTSQSFFTPSAKKDELKWLEWQAHKLAPRILMPKEMFKAKAIDVIQEAKSDATNDAPCDYIVDALSSFFIVSRISVKYRLNEDGLTDSLKHLTDYVDIFDSIENGYDFTKITAEEAFSLIANNSMFASWIEENHLVFAEGYFVAANPDYVIRSGSSFKLTAKAKRNLKTCALNIGSQVIRDYSRQKKDLKGVAFLCRTTSSDKRLITFDPSYQSDFRGNPDDAYQAFSAQLFNDETSDEFVELLASPSSSLCECLWYLMEKQGMKYPADFEERSLLNKNYHGKIKKNNYNNMGKDILMALCVGLGLSVRTVLKLFDKSMVKLDEHSDPDKTRLRIIEQMPALSIGEYNSVLVARGLQELGSTIRA